MNWNINDNIFYWGQKTYIMGILNTTPDSFSDGGEFDNLETALSQAKKMVDRGASIIDIGGESTRPNAESVALAEELNRVVPIIQHIRRFSSIPISIDTTKAKVAEAAIAEGANIINDISGGTFDAEMLPTAAKLNVPIILMHIKGNPQTMQQLANYEDVVAEVMQFLTERVEKAIACGVTRENIAIDPGIGFAKNDRQNIELLKRLSEFETLNLPILIGVSRKSFIGRILERNNPKERVWGTAAACCSAISSGADILRVHDVAEMHDVCRIADAIWRE